MILRVRVIPRSKKNEVIDVGDNRVRVKVVSPPADGRANRELIESLARYYKTSRSSITIKKGIASRDKVVEITDV
ncbi:DUF167 domain-containing protein [candidate division WOR-3 bacterium]|nr:DUF167 domain-containing protein [candidate division WOR-3 bacterium]